MLIITVIFVTFSVTRLFGVESIENKFVQFAHIKKRHSDVGTKVAKKGENRGVLEHCGGVSWKIGQNFGRFF